MEQRGQEKRRHTANKNTRVMVGFTIRGEEGWRFDTLDWVLDTLQKAGAEIDTATAYDIEDGHDYWEPIVNGVDQRPKDWREQKEKRKQEIKEWAAGLEFGEPVEIRPGVTEVKVIKETKPRPTRKTNRKETK